MFVCVCVWQQWRQHSDGKYDGKDDHHEDNHNKANHSKDDLHKDKKIRDFIQGLSLLEVKEVVEFVKVLGLENMNICNSAVEYFFKFMNSTVLSHLSVLHFLYFRYWILL